MMGKEKTLMGTVGVTKRCKRCLFMYVNYAAVLYKITFVSQSPVERGRILEFQQDPLQLGTAGSVLIAHSQANKHPVIVQALEYIVKSDDQASIQ